jgi:hypothetical protein
MGALVDGERLLALARRAHETDGLLAREAPLKQEPWIRNTHVGQLHGEQRLAGAVVVGVPGVDRGGTGGGAAVAGCWSTGSSLVAGAITTGWSGGIDGGRAQLLSLER